MTVDAAVMPGLLLLALELLALASVGYLVARVALGQADDRLAMAQGLVIGPALWGLIVNFVLFLLPGRAGALASWVLLLALAGGLVWRAPQPVRPRLRTAAGFAVVTLVVFWVMLAARQLLQIPDEAIHLGLSTYIQSGGWPPVISWTPDQPLLYHYGTDLLIGLLAPPVGPDLPFTTELLSAYLWTGFALVISAAILKHSGWIGLLTLSPLLFTTGAWTLVGFIIRPPDILQIPAPTGLPAAGLRASLANLYWPEVSLQWQTVYDASPPNIWKPPFVMAYALTVIVLTWAASLRPRSWPAVLTLAALVGFLGLLSEEIALLTMALWGALEAGRVVPQPSHLAAQARERLRSVRSMAASSSLCSEAPRGRTTQPHAPDGYREPDVRSGRWTSLLRPFAGPALAALLLVVGGGPISALLSGVSSGTHLGWIEDPGSRLPFGTLLTPGASGLGLLGLGVVPVAAAALLLAWRQRVVLALVAGAGVFMLAAIALQHPAFPFDVTRMDGHARNYALLALVLALSSRLTTLRPGWRYAVGALLVGFVTWPTVAASIRTFGLEIGHGVELTNVRPGPRGRDAEFDSDQYFWGMGRSAIKHSVSFPVARYIRGHTSVEDRILSPHPYDMTATTGRHNASGFMGLLHLFPNTGPEYEDAVRYFEPAAVRRLGFMYLHAPGAWLAMLPNRAQRWLEEPQLFEPLARGDADALYRIQPAFLDLDPPPAPASFEALRQTVPASASVYFAGGLSGRDQVRLASALAHTRLLGEMHSTGTHLLTRIPTESVRGYTPNVLLVPRGFAFTTKAREFSLIWWNDELAAYATDSGITPVVDQPPPPIHSFAVRLTDVRVEGDRVAFSATFADRAPERWTGQDWLVIEVDETPWSLPTGYEADGFTNVGRLWFAGQIVPSGGMVSHRYEFNARMKRLAVGDGDGVFAARASSGEVLAPGTYVLAVRLRLDHLQAAVIPVLRFVISEAGAVTYTVYEGERSAGVNACPALLQHTDSCRRLAGNGATAGS